MTWIDEMNGLLKRIFYGVPTIMKAEKFSNDRMFTIKAAGNGKGVRQLTIRNTGDYFLIIDDVAEVIPSGAAFTIFIPNLVTNESLPLRFGDVDPNSPAAINATTPLKEAVVRYLVDVC